jgi:hypothetical protein
VWLYLIALQSFCYFQYVRDKTFIQRYEKLQEPQDSFLRWGQATTVYLFEKVIIINN